MKLKLIDKEKKGFARYCPTFARGFEVMIEKVRKRKIVRLAKALGDEDVKVQIDAFLDLNKVVKKGGDITIAIPALMNFLEDEYIDVWGAYIEGLGMATKKGIDTTIAESNLIDMFVNYDNREMQKDTVWASRNVEVNNKIKDSVINALVKALGVRDVDVRCVAIRALVKAGEDEKTWEIVQDALLKVIGDWHFEYMQDAAANVLWKVAKKGIDKIVAMQGLVKLLADGNSDIRLHAAGALMGAAVNEVDITVAVPALTTALDDENEGVRIVAAKALKKASEKNAKIIVAVPALGKALGDENAYVQFSAAKALGMAANTSEDISVAVPALVEVLWDMNDNTRGIWTMSNWMRENIYETLGKIILDDPTPETKIEIVRSIMNLMNSDSFMRDTEKNRFLYHRTIACFDRITQQLKQAA